MNVFAFLEQNLQPTLEARRQRGEVFTPLELVNEMLDHLPSHVWRDPTLKWFDPACGIGNFPLIVFARLDTELREWEPDDEKRQEHIVRNMLVLNELDESNVATATSLFTLISHRAPIIHQGDYLSMSEDVKYDIILGNPPYNQNGVNKGGGTLWPKFVWKAFRMVKEGGYITFVHPLGWRKFYSPTDRKNQGSIWTHIRNNYSLVYINLDDRPRFKKAGNVGVLTDYYVIKADKSEPNTEYSVHFNGQEETGRANLLRLSFLPHLLGEMTLNILKKLFSATGMPISIVYNQSFKPKKTDMLASGVPHFHYIAKDGSRKHAYKAYTETPMYISHPKVLMTYSNARSPWNLNAFYSEEPMGGTNKSMYMLVESPEQANKVVSFLNSVPVAFLLRITQYGAKPYGGNEFRMLNQLRIPDSNPFTEEEMEFMKNILKTDS